MADKGMDAANLALKAMEISIIIQEKEMQKSKLGLEIERMKIRMSEYAQSIVAIDEQIETHKVDHESVQAARARVLAGEN